MSDPFIGQIALFPYTYAPKNWAECNGQLLSVAQNQALFAVIGTIYGGNGTTNFALPALNRVSGLNGGRVMAGFGNGPGLTPRALGAITGEENHTLITSEMPAHTHNIAIGTAALTGASSAHAVPAANDVLVDPLFNTFLPVASISSSTTLGDPAVSNAGGGQGHNNIQPVLALRWCIALVGIFPTPN